MITNDIQGNRRGDGRATAMGRADDVKPADLARSPDPAERETRSVLQEKLDQIAIQAPEPAVPERDLDADR